MIAATKTPCPECGYGNGTQALSCTLCGIVLHHVERELRRPLPPVPVRVRPPACEPLSVTAKYLLAGLVLAPIFTFTPVLRFMGWFLGALVHETGHCAFAWLAGCPSFPSIRLDGHALAVHNQQQAVLCVLIWVGIASLVWRFRESRKAVWVLGVAALLYPLYAFTGLRRFFFLVGGHTGELLFATIFFWRALVGGFTQSRAERVAYATLAFFLVGRNLWLTGGLMWSDEVRHWYASSGSYGVTNDYIRLARDVMGVGLSTVAFMMFVAALAVLPAAWYLARVTRRRA